MGYRVEERDLTGDEKCILCETDDIRHPEYEYAVCSDSKDFICQKCLFGQGKVWKFRVEPHPQEGDYGYMVTDDFQDIQDWMDMEESYEGVYEVIVDFGYENLDLFIDRKLEEKEKQEQVENK